MAPEKQATLLTIHGSNTVFAFIERHTWALHPVVKDHICDQVAKDLVEAGPPYANRSLDSSGKSQNFHALFIDNKDEEGMIIPPRPILKMYIQKEECLFAPSTS